MDYSLARGLEADIDTAIEESTLKEGDIVFTTDDLSNIYTIEADGKKLVSSRQGENLIVTQKDIEVMGMTFGNLTNGQVIPKNTSLTDILKMIVQKRVPASYTQPTITIANNSGTAPGSYEVGTTISPIVRSTFTQKDAGAISAHEILKNGASIHDGGATNVVDFTVPSFVLGDSNVTIASKATYAEGPIKDDNFGDPSPNGHIAAGSKTSSAMTYTAKRKCFYGTGTGATPSVTSAIVRGLDHNVLGPAPGTKFTVNIAVGEQYVIIAYPSSIRDISQIKYEETNDIGFVSSFKKSTVQVADSRGGNNGLMEYKVYTFAMAVGAGAPMTLSVTI